MTQLKWIAIAGTSLALFACGEAKTYTIIHNNCDTGTHTFGSLKEYCDGLQNNQLNNQCAVNQRAEKFKEEGCEGKFRPH